MAAFVELVVKLSFAWVAGIHAYRLLLSFSTTMRPLALNYTDGIIVAQAMDWSSLYTPIDQAPFVTSIYGPVYYYVIGFVNMLSPVGTPWQVARLTMWLVILLTAVVAAFLVWHETYNRFASLITAFLIVANPLITGVTLVNRVDHFAILFGVCAVYVYRNVIWRQARILIPICLALMFLSKQSLAAPAVVIALGLWYSRGRTKALYVALSTLGIGVAVIGLLTLIHSGSPFHHMVIYNGVNDFSLNLAAGHATLAMALLFPLVLIYVLPSIIPDHVEGIPKEYVVWASVSLVIALVTASKIGAHVGYYMAPATALAIVAGIQLGRTRAGWIRNGILVALIVQAGIFAGWAPQSPIDERAQADVAALADGNVLSEDNSLGTEPADTLMYRSLRDTTALTNAIQAQEYDYIVLRYNPHDQNPHGRWTPETQRAITENYYLRYQTGGYWVFARE